MLDIDKVFIDFIFFLRRASFFFYEDWVSNVWCCSLLITNPSNCAMPVTLTRTDVFHVHQSTISADKDAPAKNINLGPGSYGRMVVWSGVVRSGVVGS